MSTDREQPWWEEVQDYRRSSGSAASQRAAQRERARRAGQHPARPVARGAVRSTRDDRVIRSQQAEHLWEATPLAGDESAARRRRAADARAAAQRRRARRERNDSLEYQWVDESPFSVQTDERDAERERVEREREYRARQRTRADGSEHRPARPRSRQRSRNQVHPAWRPERLLLYAAILGIFLVFAAATNSDASAAVALLQSAH